MARGRRKAMVAIPVVGLILAVVLLWRIVSDRPSEAGGARPTEASTVPTDIAAPVSLLADSAGLWLRVGEDSAFSAHVGDGTPLAAAEVPALREKLLPFTFRLQAELERGAREGLPRRRDQGCVPDGGCADPAGEHEVPDWCWEPSPSGRLLVGCFQAYHVDGRTLPLIPPHAGGVEEVTPVWVHALNDTAVAMVRAGWPDHDTVLVRTLSGREPWRGTLESPAEPAGVVLGDTLLLWAERTHGTEAVLLDRSRPARSRVVPTERILWWEGPPPDDRRVAPLRRYPGAAVAWAALGGDQESVDVVLGERLAHEPELGEAVVESEGLGVRGEATVRVTTDWRSDHVFRDSVAGWLAGRPRFLRRLDHRYRVEVTTSGDGPARRFDLTRSGLRRAGVSAWSDGWSRRPPRPVDAAPGSGRVLFEGLEEFMYGEGSGWLEYFWADPAHGVGGQVVLHVDPCGDSRPAFLGAGSFVLACEELLALDDRGRIHARMVHGGSVLAVPLGDSLFLSLAADGPDNLTVRDLTNAPLAATSYAGISTGYYAWTESTPLPRLAGHALAESADCRRLDRLVVAGASRAAPLRVWEGEDLLPDGDLRDAAHGTFHVQAGGRYGGCDRPFLVRLDPALGKAAWRLTDPDTTRRHHSGVDP